MNQIGWEVIADEQFDRLGCNPSFFGQTSRLQVPGGWIYKTVYWMSESAELNVTQMFVSDDRQAAKAGEG